MALKTRGDSLKTSDNASELALLKLVHPHPSRAAWRACVNLRNALAFGLVTAVAFSATASAHPNAPTWTSSQAADRLEGSPFAKRFDIENTFCFGVGSERPGGSDRYRHHVCTAFSGGFKNLGYVLLHVTGPRTFKAEWLDRL